MRYTKISSYILGFAGLIGAGLAFPAHAASLTAPNCNMAFSIDETYSYQRLYSGGGDHGSYDYASSQPNCYDPDAAKYRADKGRLALYMADLKSRSPKVSSTDVIAKYYEFGRLSQFVAENPEAECKSGKRGVVCENDYGALRTYGHLTQTDLTQYFASTLPKPAAPPAPVVVTVPVPAAVMTAATGGTSTTSTSPVTASFDQYMVQNSAEPALQAQEVSQPVFPENSRSTAGTISTQYHPEAATRTAPASVKPDDINAVTTASSAH